MPELKVTSQLTAGVVVGAAAGNPQANMRLTRTMTTSAVTGAATSAAHFYLENVTDRLSASGGGASQAPRTIRMTNRQTTNDSGFIQTDEFPS